MTWRWVSTATEERYARVLARKFVEFEPEYVVYLERGGRLVGQVVAEHFGVPVLGMEISYPASPIWNSMPKGVRIFTWPLKELLYRLGRPSLNRNRYPDLHGQRLALVDDSASSGRSLAAVIELFSIQGIPRGKIRTGVLRCGRRAQEVVDYYVSTEQMLFVGR